MSGSPLRGILKTGLALTICMGLCPALASAANPFVLDNTSNARTPTVAVDSDGVAHFAWTISIPNGDDIVRYCRVPRNGTECKQQRDFRPPREGINPPRVIVHPDGRVLIYTLRCCGVSHPPAQIYGPAACAAGSETEPDKWRDPNLDYGYLYESSDGGATWNPDIDYYPEDETECVPLLPRVVGSVISESDIVAGPGEFSIGIVSSGTGAANFQAAPIAGFPSGGGGFGAAQGQAYLRNGKFNVADEGRGVNNPSAYSSLALVDPLTPITAMTDLSHVYVRKFNGGANYYERANWEQPFVDLGPGTEPELVGGKRGVHLAYKTQDVPRQFRVRRFGGMSFGSSKALTPKGDPIFGDFFQDAGGNLNFTWQENGPDELRYRVSKDGGKTWSDVKTLAGPNAGQFFNTEIAAAKDAGGFIAWDGNGKGPIRVVQFGPTKPVSDDDGGEQECVPQVKVAAATVLAREGCLQRDGSKYRTKGDVRINGIDFYPSSGAQVVIDTADRTITTNGKVEARVGNVVLDRAEIAWEIPQNGGQILDLGGNPAVFDTGQFNVEVLGLGVSGQTSPKVNSDGSVEIPVNLGLPEPFAGLGGLGDITGRATLRADLQGLHLAGLKVHAKDVGLGIATIDELLIEYYDDPSLFRGSADLSLPVTGAGILTDFGFREGNFDYAKATLVFPGDGILVATLVYLREIGFEVSTDPTKIGGSLKLGGGPKVFGTDLIAVTGTVSYTFPDSPNPGIFRAEGTGSIVDIQVANIFTQYETSGKFSFGGHIEVGDENLGIKVDAEGFLDLDKGLFEMYNDAGVCILGCVGATGLINNNVIAGCIGGDLAGLGVLYEWGDGVEQLFSCDLDEYRLLASARIAQAGSQTVTVQRGLPSAGVLVSGNGAAPRVTVTGPQGQTIATGADPSQIVNTTVGVIAPDVRNNRTLVLLRKPAGGSWTVATQPNSAPVTGLRTANGLAKPKVDAVVRGKGRRRTLEYEVSPVQSGQRVRFSEVGSGAYSILGTTTDRKGTIRFAPADGRKGRRRIFAVIEQNGRPRDRVLAATYKAPGRILPSKPRGVTLRRKGNKLVVRWGRSSNAKRYAVRVSLKDGRRLVIPTSRRRLVIRDVPGIDSGTIAVMGLRPDNSAGPAAKAKLKAKPKKRKRSRR